MKRAHLRVSLSLTILLAFASTALAQDKVQPPTVSLAIGVGKTTATVSWTAPGDACTNATIAEYDVRYSTSAITECNFTSASQFPNIPTPSSPGNTDCADFGASTGVLTCNTAYYFAWKCKDSAGNWSDIATATGTTRTCSPSSPEIVCQ